MLLSRPGTSVRLVLPSTQSLPKEDRVFVELKVMDRGMALWVQGAGEAGLGNFEMCRRVIGLCITKIDGIRLRPDNTEWQPRKDAEGYLEEESAEILQPLHNELVELILKAATLTPIEQKNS